MGGVEGLIIASEDSKFHSGFYTLTGLIFLAYMSAVRQHGYGVKGVWIGMAMYQWLRLSIFSLRIRHKLLRK